AQLGDRAGVIAGGQLVDIGRIDEIGGADARVPIVRWVDGGERRQQRTDQPAEFVARLVAEHGGEPNGVEIVRPSLEDVYLGLVSRSSLPELVEAPTATEGVSA